MQDSDLEIHGLRLEITAERALLWAAVLKTRESHRVTHGLFIGLVSDALITSPTSGSMSRMEVAWVDRCFTRQDFMRALENFYEHLKIGES